MKTPPSQQTLSGGSNHRLVQRLRLALADAIRRPMGVIPDSATGLVTWEELAAAEKRRMKTTEPQRKRLREKAEAMRKRMEEKGAEMLPDHIQAKADIETLNQRLIDRREAYEDYIAKQRIIGTLTVEWRGQRYWCRGCSRMGDVWITKDPTGATYYDHRVNVEELPKLVVDFIEEHGMRVITEETAWEIISETSAEQSWWKLFECIFEQGMKYTMLELENRELLRENAERWHPLAENSDTPQR